MGSRPVLLWKMILAAAALNGRKACAQRADARVREVGKQALSGPFAGMEASLVEVSYPPGGRSAEHRHPGFIVGYVLDGRIRFAINQETPRVLGTGEMFYEPTGALHSTSENAQPGMPAKILGFMVAPPEHRLWRESEARQSSTMDGVGPATESRDCVPIRGRRPAGRLGAARVAARELGRLAPLPHLCRPVELVHARRRSARGGCAGHSRRGDLCHCPNHRFPAARGGNWVRSASYDFRDFDGAEPRNEGAARLFRVYSCNGSILASRIGSRSQARNPRGRKSWINGG